MYFLAECNCIAIVALTSTECTLLLSPSSSFGLTVGNGMASGPYIHIQDMPVSFMQASSFLHVVVFVNIAIDMNRCIESFM